MSHGVGFLGRPSCAHGIAVGARDAQAMFLHLSLSLCGAFNHSVTRPCDASPRQHSRCWHDATWLLVTILTRTLSQGAPSLPLVSPRHIPIRPFPYSPADATRTVCLP